VRLSGPEAWLISAKVFRDWPANPVSHHAVYGRYITGDDGIALPFGEGRSYTGEPSVELSCHGSLFSMRALVEACVRAGARPARPGEFTERAFLSGRIDLTEAEAVADTVNALTEAQLRIANLQREGALLRAVSDVRHRVAKVLAAVEASVDFEEEIGPLDRSWASDELRSAATAAGKLRQTAEIGRIIRRGLRIAIVGRPNAGKSSLFNAIVGRERAIVTPQPGTTRDYLEELIDVGGIPVMLVDTAGMRMAADIAEKAGVERSSAQAMQADAVWYVFDASIGLSHEDEQTLRSFPQALVIANKCDLKNCDGFLNVSAKTGNGLEDLVHNVTIFAEEAKSLEIPPIDERHKPLLDSTLQMIHDAQETLAHQRPDDLLTTFLRSAISHLDEITGDSASADMIERIFADFCIGK